MHLVSIIIINLKKKTSTGHFQNWDWRDLKSLELELELELKSLELELELKLIVSSGIGIGIGIENNGIGIELKKWNWPQPCLSPGRRQAIIWTNAGILLIGPLGTNFSEILVKIIKFSSNKVLSKVSSGKRWPSCLSLNVLSGLASIGTSSLVTRCVVQTI